MNLKNVVWSEVRQRNLYVESELQYQCIYVQNINGLTDIEIKLLVTKGEMVMDKLEAWNVQTQTTTQKINNKDLLYHTGNYIQNPIKTYNGEYV